MNQQLPLNVLKRGSIKYFNLNFNQHKDFYNYFEESIVDDFLDAVYARFVPDGEIKIQGYAEIVNQQGGDNIITEHKRVWLTNVYTAKHMNP